MKHSCTWSPVAIWDIFELLQNDILFITFFRHKMLIWKSENGLVLHHSAFLEPATEKSYHTNTIDHSISYSSCSKGSFTSEVILNDNKWRIWRYWWCWWQLLWRYLGMKKKNRTMMKMKTNARVISDLLCNELGVQEHRLQLLGRHHISWGGHGS